MRTQIIITFQFSAIHAWPGCDVPSVPYLKYPHRHVFHVEMKKKVTHTDRDVEFIDFKEQVLRWVGSNWEGKDLGSMSCEEMAGFLKDLFLCSYVKVMEDGENGAEVYE